MNKMIANMNVKTMQIHKISKGWGRRKKNGKIEGVTNGTNTAGCRKHENGEDIVESKGRERNSAGSDRLKLHLTLQRTNQQQAANKSLGHAVIINKKSKGISHILQV